MCKPNQTILPSAGGFQKILSTTMGAVLLGLLFSLPVTQALAQFPCVKCPNITGPLKPAVGIANGLTVVRNINGVPTPLSVDQGDVGACEVLLYDVTLSYNRFGPGG